FVASIMKASELIEALYAKQQGTTELAAKVPADDPASKTLFFRNQRPKCEAPATVNDKNCGALLLADMPAGKISGMYPKDILLKDKFCEQLGKKGNGLADPFTVVTSAPEATDAALKAASSEKGDTVSAARLAQLKATPFHVAWPSDVDGIAKELKGAAEGLG